MVSSEGLYSKASPLNTRKESKDQEEISTCALQIAAPKFERIYEKDGFLFEKHCPVTLLKQGSTADIFQGNYQLFLTKQFHKNNSERLIGKGVHLFSKPNYYCFGMATVEV